MAKIHLTKGTAVVGALDITEAGGLTVGGVAVTAPPGDLNYIDIATLGTGAASKAVVLDAGEDYVWPPTGVLTYGVLKDPAGTTLGATAAEVNAVADISAAGAVHKVKKISISAAPTGAEQDSAFDLPAKAKVMDVFVEVTTAEVTGGTKTLDVGLLSGESGGDADGFVDGLSVAATGVFRGGVALDGGSAYFATCTRGLLLRDFVAGAGTDDRGLYNEKPHMSSAVTAKSVSYTGGSNDFVEFRGAIYIVYVELG